MTAIRRVWITRARPGAERTAERLAELGFAPLIAPLLAIRPLAAQVDGPLDAATALAFTSVNGVAAFAALTERRDRPVFAVGAATARAARDAGFSDVRSADGDAVALAGLIRAAASGPVLAPGAREPAADLAALTGGRVVALPVYEAVETVVPSPDGWDAVLIHSPRAGRALAAMSDAAGGADGGVAACISAAAAAPLAALPLAEIRVADRPDEASLLALLGKPPRPV